MNTTRPASIIAITSWSPEEQLLMSYVLPYLRLIREMLPSQTVMYIVVWEKPEATASSHSQTFFSATEELNISVIKVPQKKFGWAAMLMHARTIIRLLRFARRNHITHFHSFAPPASAMALILHRLYGGVFIADSWEPHASAMVESGVWQQGSAANRILSYIERKIPARADYLLAASPHMGDYAAQQGARIKGTVLLRPACVNTAMFDPGLFDRIRLREEHGFDNNDVLGICVSKLGGLYLDIELFRFFVRLREGIGPQFKALIVSPTPLKQIEEWAAETGLSRACWVYATIAHREVPRWLAMADFAINPQRAVPSKRYGAPVKDGEYWSMGLPLVIQPGISLDSDLMAERRAGILLRGLSDLDMDRTVEELKELLQREPRPVKRMRELAIEQRSFETVRSVYKTVYGAEIKNPDPLA